MKCFYHNDIDGRCAGFLVAYMNNNFNREDFFEVNYSQELPIDKVKDNEKVWFVDYCFTDKTIGVLESLQQRGCDIIWIDHHVQSCELDENPKYHNIKGIRNKAASGAALTYMYLCFESGEFNDYTDEEIHKNLYKLPMYVQLVDDYDRWIFSLGDNVTHFKIGIECDDYNFDAEVLKELQSSDYKMGSIIKLGAQIKQYIDSDNANYLKLYSYESEILGHKCLVVNRKTNSWIFGDKINEYPICMVYVFDGTNYVYSIFTKDENIDCSEIAKQFGGGGHKGAAGFQNKELLFKKKEIK